MKNFRFIAFVMIFCVGAVVMQGCTRLKVNRELDFRDKQLQIRPDDAVVFFKKGQAFMEKKEYREAIRAFHETLQRDSDFGAAYILLGASYYHLGQFEKAHEAYMKALDLSEDLDVYLGLGMVDIKLEKYEDAIKAYEAARAIDPKNLTAYLNIGYLYGELGKPKEARKYYKTALRYDPYSAQAMYGLGLMYIKEGDYQAGLDQMIKVVELRPNYVNARYELGKLFVFFGQRDYALGEYEALKELDPYKAQELKSDIDGIGLVDSSEI